MGLKIITIHENDSGQRLDKFCMKCFPNLPKSKFYSAVRKKDIRLNDRRTAGNEILEIGDILRIFLPDDILNSGKKEIMQNDLPIDIIYEDENIVLINKPVGLNVYAPSGEDSILARLLGYLKFNQSEENSFTPAFCNRLDRNTSGILIAGKNAAALRDMNKIIRENLVTKEYLAVCYGYIEKNFDKITNYIKSTENDMVKSSKKMLDGYKKSITEYKVLQRKKNLSLVNIKLITGRKHQIRVTFADFGHFVLGDNKYGRQDINKQYNLKYQLLVAYKITFKVIENSCLSYLSNKSFEIEKSKLNKINKYFI